MRSLSIESIEHVAISITVALRGQLNLGGSQGDANAISACSSIMGQCTHETFGIATKA